MENPKAYYIFYLFFYKAAVGEVCLKQCMDSSEERISNNTTEAFVLLLFANNYKAWLYEEKLAHGEALLRTKYDSCDRDGMDSIVDTLLGEQEFILDEYAGDMPIIFDTTKQLYKKAVKARKDLLVEFKGLPVCTEMMRTWGPTACNMIEDGGGE